MDKLETKVDKRSPSLIIKTGTMGNCESFLVGFGSKQVIFWYWKGVNRQSLSKEKDNNKKNLVSEASLKIKKNQREFSK